MSLQVGLHSDIIFAKGERNERGTLIVGLKKVGEVDMIALMNGNNSATSFGGQDQDFMIFPPKVENMKNEIDSTANLLKKIAEVKDPLNHILQQYLPNSDIKWDIMKNTGINKENMERKLASQATLDQIYTNIVDQFLTMAAAILANPNPRRLRALLIRRSVAKPFAELRKRFLDTYPFLEPMDIPESASKLRFSKYEMDKGLNTGDPITENTPIDQAEAAAADEALMSH